MLRDLTPELTLRIEGGGGGTGGLGTPSPSCLLAAAAAAPGHLFFLCLFSGPPPLPLLPSSHLSTDSDSNSIY